MSASFFYAVITFLAHTDLPPFAFALIIGVPSAALYCLELWMLVTNFAEFNSTFFVLVIVRAILNLINYVSSFFEQRFGKIGFFLSLYLKLPRFVLALLLFVSRYIFHAENLLTSFLLLNRISSILIPFKYEKLWRYALLPILLVIFVLPLPFTFEILNLDMYINVLNDNVTFTLDNRERAVNTNPSYSLRAACSALIFVTISLLLNLATLFAFKFGHAQNIVHQNNQNLERKLTVYTVVTFLGQLVIAIYMIILYMTSAQQFVDVQNNTYCLAQLLFGISHEESEMFFHANFNQYPWINDLSTIVIPSWLLLWASSRMRKKMYKKIKSLNQKLKRFFVNWPRNRTQEMRMQPIAAFMPK